MMWLSYNFRWGLSGFVYFFGKMKFDRTLGTSLIWSLISAGCWGIYFGWWGEDRTKVLGEIEAVS